ncbi:MAG: GntR family transcriptional regulator [Sulfobacillus sp.]|nr:GntR family transcriptional regulator [Sulfobacillus sp.]
MIPDTDVLRYPLPFNIAEAIAAQILAGEFRPGERLKEGELAHRYRTSRAPIREALYLLQVQGLIERVPRRGTVVRTYTAEDIEALYQTRIALELLAVDRIQAHWDDTFILALQKVVHSMHRAVQHHDYPQYAADNSRFHQEIVEHGGGTVIFALWHQISYPLKYLLRASIQSEDDIARSLAEHERIVEAFQHLDFEVVKNVLRENILHGMQRVLAEHHPVH